MSRVIALTAMFGALILATCLDLAFDRHHAGSALGATALYLALRRGEI